MKTNTRHSRTAPQNSAKLTLRLKPVHRTSISIIVLKKCDITQTASSRNAGNPDGNSGVCLPA